MVTQHSVVTPERFTSGLTYPEYLAQIKVNKDRFEEYHRTGQISDEDAKFFSRAAQLPNGATKVLVLGEDWCPDVFRGLPVVTRIAEAAGMELRIFPRDQNLDIMNEFLNQGRFMSIPVAVFYSKAQRYICHWIERPALANRERATIEEQVKQAMPSASDQEIRREIRDRTQARYPAWQQETVREIRQLLVDRLNLR